LLVLNILSKPLIVLWNITSPRTIDQVAVKM
jgi:hypothetical protein